MISPTRRPAAGGSRSPVCSVASSRHGASPRAPGRMASCSGERANRFVLPRHPNAPSAAGGSPASSRSACTPAPHVREPDDRGRRQRQGPLHVPGSREHLDHARSLRAPHAGRRGRGGGADGFVSPSCARRRKVSRCHIAGRMTVRWQTRRRDPRDLPNEVLAIERASTCTELSSAAQLAGSRSRRNLVAAATS
jgi:hypothetical protein